uniref:Histidine kinase n=1 Tax=Heterorhabditis bacteriophora TaxID=37862 RepID=A0A1I7XUC4_HETBA
MLSMVYGMLQNEDGGKSLKEHGKGIEREVLFVPQPTLGILKALNHMVVCLEDQANELLC